MLIVVRSSTTVLKQCVQQSKLHRLSGWCIITDQKINSYTGRRNEDTPKDLILGADELMRPLLPYYLLLRASY